MEQKKPTCKDVLVSLENGARNRKLFNIICNFLDENHSLPESLFQFVTFFNQIVINFC